MNIIKRILILTVFSLLAVCSAAGQTWYAEMSGDTLSLGNSRIERKFLWNGGHLKTVSLTDKSNGLTRRVLGELPDLVLVKDMNTGVDGHLNTEVVPQNEIHPAYFKVTVTYRLGELDVRREYRIYEDTPAIACDTYLKGVLGRTLANDQSNHADRKNIESADDMKSKPVTMLLDQLKFCGKHWHAKAVEFWDVTDWNNNLLAEREVITYRKNNYRGNLLMVRSGVDGHGFLQVQRSISDLSSDMEEV